jgi:O-antigen/teichoic acid export membrane protein
MQQVLKRLAKMVAGYGMVQWAGPFISFIFTPIITRILNPDDYGISDYILTVGSAVGVISLFALPQAVAAHFNDQQNADWQRRVTGSAFGLALLIGTIAGLGLFVFAPVLAQSSSVTQRYTFLFQWMAATIVLSLCGTVLSSAAQAGLRVRWGMWLSITSILGTVVGNVLFIIVLRLGVTGMVLTPMATGMAVCIVALALAHGTIGRPSLDIALLLLRTGAILLPAALAGWGLQVADRLFLIRYVPPQELGYYAIANKIATLVYVMIGPLFTAYTPLALSMQHDPDAKCRYAVISRYLIAATLCASLALGLFATELLIVLTRTAYLPAAVYVGFLTYMHTFGAINTILYTSGLAGKQFKGITWTVLAGAVVNLALNFVLIPPLGVWGATFATVIGYAVPPVLLYLWLQPRYPVPYPVARIAAAIGVQLGLLVIGLYLPALKFPIRVSIKFLIFMLLPLSFIPIGMITRLEVQQTILLVRHQLIPQGIRLLRHRQMEP